MDLRLIYALILTIIPVTELRFGLPLAINYALDNGNSIMLVFSLIVLLNILVIFFIFYFLDNLHKIFLKSKTYKKYFTIFLGKFRKRVDKFEKKYESLGFIALILFVSIPFPGTGVWSGSLISWILGLDRKKSIISISIGTLIAGILVLLGTLGFISLFL